MFFDVREKLSIPSGVPAARDAVTWEFERRRAVRTLSRVFIVVPLSMILYRRCARRRVSIHDSSRRDESPFVSVSVSYPIDEASRSRDSKTRNARKSDARDRVVQSASKERLIYLGIAQYRGCVTRKVAVLQCWKMRYTRDRSPASRPSVFAEAMTSK